MAERRRELRLSATAAAQIAGINRATWSTAENAQRVPQPHNRAGIEQALAWESGSVDRLLAGGRAVERDRPVAAAPPADEVDIDAEVARIQAGRWPAATKLRMLRALIALHQEAAEQGDSPVERRTG